MLEKMPGVIAAYPDGASRTIAVHMRTKKKPMTEKVVKAAFRKYPKFELVSITQADQQAQGSSN